MMDGRWASVEAGRGERGQSCWGLADGTSTFELHDGLCYGICVFIYLSVCLCAAPLQMFALDVSLSSLALLGSHGGFLSY